MRVRTGRIIVITALVLLIITSGFFVTTRYSPLSKDQTTIADGLDYLNNNLWNDSAGGYKEIQNPAQLGNLALAYYYAWYGDPGHVPTWLNGSTYNPVLDGYNSSDPAVIRQHLSWIKQAGLNGVLVSYWDRRLAGGTMIEDDAVHSLFEMATESPYSGMRIALMMERVVSDSGAKWGVSEKKPMNFSDPSYETALVQEIDHIIDDYYKPFNDVYLTLNGHPVIALYAFLDSGQTTNETEYAQFFSNVKNKVLTNTGLEVSFWSLNTVDPSLQPPIFDITAIYNPLEQRRNNTDNSQSPWPVQSPVYTTQSGVRVASIIPGYNDTLRRTGNPVYGRSDGALYSQQWAQAMGYDSQVILVTSFNEWHESTSIEPSTEWGTKYLDLTHNFIDQLPYRSSDNQLGLTFNTAYFLNQTRAQRLTALLSDRILPNDMKNRWIPLSSDPCGFRPYNSTDYADQMALNAIYYARCGERTTAQALLAKLVSTDFYDYSTGLVSDTATPTEGHAYYKIALALLLANQLRQRDWASRFASTLLSLQRGNGSWLTDDKPGTHVWPNSETTMLILAALDQYSALYLSPLFYTALAVVLAVDAAMVGIAVLALKTRFKRASAII